MFVVNSFLSGNRMGKRSTKRGSLRASLFVSSESGPNPARAPPQVQTPPKVGARTSNSSRFPGSEAPRPVRRRRLEPGGRLMSV
mgnify:CR=1 FL=1